MEIFAVTSLERAGKLLLIGVAAGVLFYLVDFYVIAKAEAALNLPNTTAAA